MTVQELVAFGEVVHLYGFAGFLILLGIAAILGVYRIRSKNAPAPPQAEFMDEVYHAKTHATSRLSSPEEPNGKIIQFPRD